MKILCIGGASDGHMREVTGTRLTTAAAISPVSIYEYDRQPSPVIIEKSYYRIECMSFSTREGVEKRYFWVEESLTPLQAMDRLIEGYRQPAKASVEA
ncbi:MAG: hypothetical protein WDN46_14265 [Methylocella sp.]